MSYEFTTAKKLFAEAASKGMTALEAAEAAVRNQPEKSANLADIGAGYARMAQAAADVMEDFA